MPSKKKSRVHVAQHGSKYRVHDLDAVEATNLNRVVGAEQKPLYVMMDAHSLETYRRLADVAGMSLREYVTRALQSFAASQSLAGLPATASHVFVSGHGGPDPEPDWMLRHLNQHALRLGELEKRVDAIQRRVDGQWGPDTGRRPVLARETLNILDDDDKE